MMLLLGIGIGTIIGWSLYPVYLRRLSNTQSWIRRVQHGQKRKRHV